MSSSSTKVDKERNPITQSGKKYKKLKKAVLGQYPKYSTRTGFLNKNTVQCKKGDKKKRRYKRHTKYGNYMHQTVKDDRDWKPCLKVGLVKKEKLSEKDPNSIQTVLKHKSQALLRTTKVRTEPEPSEEYVRQNIKKFELPAQRKLKDSLNIHPYLKISLSPS